MSETLAYDNGQGLLEQLRRQWRCHRLLYTFLFGLTFRLQPELSRILSVE